MKGLLTTLLLMGLITVGASAQVWQELTGERIDWVDNDNRSNVPGRVLFLKSPFVTFLNSLVSEDWISVEDRLPEDDGLYLVATEFYRYRTRRVAYFRDENWYMSEVSHALVNATHWQTLPAPPDRK